MRDDAKVKELTAKMHQNTYFTGYGVHTATILPCPCCGAGDWLKFPVTAGLTDYKDVQGPTKCKECHRVCRVIIVRSHGMVSQETVFISGPALPDWFYPPMRVELPT